MTFNPVILKFYNKYTTQRTAMTDTRRKPEKIQRIEQTLALERGSRVQDDAPECKTLFRSIVVQATQGTVS